MVCIDYYFDSAMAKVTVDSVILWIALSTFTGLITYILYKCGKMSLSTAIILPILMFYLSFALTITIFGRTPGSKARYELELFWSYRRAAAGTKQLIWENFWNVVLFIPIGAMAAVLRKKRLWLAALFGMLLSIGIEVTQLLTYRGLFEFDDIFHNTLGAVIGVGLYLLLRKMEKRS